MSARTLTADHIARTAWSLISTPGEEITGAFTGILGHAAALNTVHAGADATADTLLANDIVSPSEREKAVAAEWVRGLHAETPADALDNTARLGLHVQAPSDIPGITALGDAAPHILWVAGDITTPALHGGRTAITITGARAASAYGERAAGEVAGALTGEAGPRSGSLGVARAAVGLGRPVGAVPGPIDSASSAGCNLLIRERHVILIDGAAAAAELVS